MKDYLGPKYTIISGGIIDVGEPVKVPLLQRISFEAKFFIFASIIIFITTLLCL